MNQKIYEKVFNKLFNRIPRFTFNGKIYRFYVKPYTYWEEDFECDGNIYGYIDDDNRFMSVETLLDEICDQGLLIKLYFTICG